ncbi:putative phosphoglycerate mutase [Microbacterium sp. AG1240]|uniref:histidine phosphatase family protein n=1 Tax=Microbacterium sp. AG1240 TaxID=2183992 RepID=UPI000EAD1E0C|nr:histidine phosphatase family protein [Microbacterium sp. AG1240]RKT37101.1 putative phosphoglycerate mutase [Microbacterium sp. AG1240]
MTILTLVRHGETDWNRDGRVQGSTDIPLNDTGRQQAREAGRALREVIDADAATVVASSDLLRAAETADLIAHELGADEPRRYRGLRERAYGEAEGMTTTDFRARWGDWFTADVPGAETWDDLRRRALETLRRTVQDARRATSPAAPALVVVAHGALIREVIRHATGGELPIPGERLPNGSAHTFLMERDRLQLLSYVAAPL